MGRTDDMSDAICGGGFGHREGSFEVFGAVIQAPKKMMMNVYHVMRLPLPSRSDL